jgi:hypothetical protein
MRVLIGAESSGVVRRAFRERGHDAWSNDLRPAEDDEKWHLVCDVREAIANPPMGEPWDLLIVHLPCTYLCNSGVWAFSKTPPNPSPGVKYGRERWVALRQACDLWLEVANAPVPMIAMENPIPHGYAVARIGPYTQTIQPYEFGDDASKRTCLWLKGLPRLEPTRYVPPRIVNGRPRWGNQTDSGQNKLPPSADRWIERSRTYPGIAAAMAEQWGSITEREWTLTA